MDRAWTAKVGHAQGRWMPLPMAPWWAPSPQRHAAATGASVSGADGASAEAATARKLALVLSSPTRMQ